jgi:hypothetical protein
MVVTHRLILTLVTHRTSLRVGVVKLHWGPRVWTLSSQQQWALVSATRSFACSCVYPVSIYCMTAVSVAELSLDWLM